MVVDTDDRRYAVYAEATSIAAGQTLRIHLERPDGRTFHDEMTLTCDVTERVVSTAVVSGPTYDLYIPEDLPSGLYRASHRSAGEDVYFAVRAAVPGSTSRILVSLPFLTWQAYNRAGEPGQSIYWNEQPDRAARVSFNRSGGGPAAERWEHGFLRSLKANGPAAEYCSGIDLHGGGELLSHYQLLIISGHDEYWTYEMRDAVEDFARRGGNIAIFGGNTSWWQARLEDQGRTMVCYRDAGADPMGRIDPSRVTVEWSSAPVSRPENSMTGLSFRRGAGNWTDFEQMKNETFTACFAEHWAFEGTGLATGDEFGAGVLGYETDAADIEYDGDVPYATGRDGTPPTFTVLATADLRHWRHFGQGGMATMGTFHLGRGTVFNAGTINWGQRLDDPVVGRITRNVLNRLGAAADPSRWDDMGPAGMANSLVSCDNLLFSTDLLGNVRWRRPGPQNLPWHPDGRSPEPIRCLASPRETTAGMPLGIYGASAADRLWYRDGETGASDWREIGPCPVGTHALAASNLGLFALAGGHLWFIEFAACTDRAVAGSDWMVVAECPTLVTMAAGNGRIFAIDDGGHLVSRLPFTGPIGWEAPPAPVPVPGRGALAVYAGQLIVVDDRDRLRYRAIPPPDPIHINRSGGSQ